MNAPARFRTADKSLRARLTVDEYYAICDSGALDRFGRTELIDGEILVVAPLHLPHARVHKAINWELNAKVQALGSKLEVLPVTIELSEHDAPLPDIVVFDRAATAGLTKGVPGSAVRLLVEVAASTSKHDLVRKRLLYAERGVPEYWVALVKKRKIERFADPADGDYRRHDTFRFDDGLDSLTLPGIGLDAGLLNEI